MAALGPLGRPFPPVFDAVDRYGWKEDSEFQSGLSSILSSDVPAEQAEELKMKAQCFYFERKFDVPIDFDEYKAWREYKANKAATKNAATAGKGKETTKQSSSSFSDVPQASDTSVPSEEISAAASGPQYPPTFAQVVELISSGRPIPGIKQIPSTVLEGQSSESVKPKRRKPWEKDDANVAGPSPNTVAT